jgi:hypothetical protein
LALAILGRRRPAQSEQKLFGGANLALCGWHGLQLIELLSVGRSAGFGEFATRALFGGQLLLSGLVLAVFAHLSCTFERVYRRQAPSLRAALTTHLHRRQRWYVYAVYTALALFASAYLADTAGLSGLLASLRDAIGPTSAYIFGLSLLFMTFVLFPARPGQERIVVPVLGRAALMLSLSLCILLIALWHESHPTRTALLLLPWLHLHSVAFVIFLALVRYEFAFMDRFIRETLRVLAWALVVAVAYMAFNRVHFPPASWASIANSTTRIAILLGAVVLGPWLGSVAARWADRVLFDRRIRLEDAIHTFAHRLHRSVTLKELIDGAAQDIARAVHARHVHIVIGGDEHLHAALRSEEERGGGYRLQVPLGVGDQRTGWILLGERRNLYPYFDGEHFFLRMSGELLGSAVAAIRRRQVLHAEQDPEAARLQQSEQMVALRSELDRLRARLRDVRERCDPELASDVLGLAEEAGARDPAAGLRIVASLRRVLQHGMEREAAPSTLGKEMAFARELLALEKLRLRNRLDVDLGYDGTLEDQAVPHGILLPLLDNAIQHGVRRELRVGWVRVRAARDGQAVELTVEDNGAGMDPSRIELQGRGGLARVLASLRALFGEASALRVESREDEPGTRVRVRMPLRFLEGRAASAAHG